MDGNRTLNARVVGERPTEPPMHFETNRRYLRINEIPTFTEIKSSRVQAFKVDLFNDTDKEHSSILNLEK